MSILNTRYTDLPIFITSNSFTGDLNIISDLSAVRQSITNLILTNNGERPFDYQLGTSLYSILFENLTLEAKMEIQSRVVNCLNLYEPRIRIRSIDTTNTTNPNEVSLKISYIVLPQNVNDELELNITRTR